MKRVTKQNKIVVGLISLILALSVGYALFSETLNINGTAKASGEFNIIFYNVGDIKEVGSSGATAVIEEPNKKILTVNVPKLEYPTAYVEIPVTIKNTGSIDAYLKGIKTTGLDTTDIKITYTDLKQNQIIKSREERNLKLRITWDKASVSQVPKLDFNIELEYEQVTNPAPPEVAYNVGDEFCLGTECFYVMKDNGNTVTALAKYNLLVGSVWDDNNKTDTPISPDTKDYGLQSESTKIKYDENIFTGSIAFSDIPYWSESGNLKSEYGTSYPANVFDENSNLYVHVNNYENYLKNNIGKTSVKVRLITLNELTELGCSNGRAREPMYDCSSAPSFIQGDRPYWTATAHRENAIWWAGQTMYTDWHGLEAYIGLRPVITISKSEI